MSIFGLSNLDISREKLYRFQSSVWSWRTTSDIAVASGPDMKFRTLQSISLGR